MSPQLTKVPLLQSLQQWSKGRDSQPTLLVVPSIAFRGAFNQLLYRQMLIMCSATVLVSRMECHPSCYPCCLCCVYHTSLITNILACGDSCAIQSPGSRSTTPAVTHPSPAPLYLPNPFDSYIVCALILYHTTEFC